MYLCARKKNQEKGAGGRLAAGQGQPTTVLWAEAMEEESLLAYVPICKQGLGKEIALPKILRKSMEVEPQNWIQISWILPRFCSNKTITKSTRV